ncbi:MAG: dihydrofolate reductase family protein [Thermoplasmatales archaeon]|nr:dihydrofolate reductase family protein [Thermoplasmatales archaeon]
MNDPTPRARPLIWVNCAISIDGRLAFARGTRARLSGPQDLARVQRLRAESDAIVVGSGTVALDDPSLAVHWEAIGRTVGRPPTRIVLDSKGSLPEGARVFDGSSPTLVATLESNRRTYPPYVERLVVGSDRVDLARLWGILYGRGMRRILVEGGARVIASVVASRTFDRLTVYVAPVLIGQETSPPMVAGPAARGFEELARLRLLGVERLDDGYVASYEPSLP